MKERKYRKEKSLFELLWMHTYTHIQNLRIVFSLPLMLVIAFRWQSAHYARFACFILICLASFNCSVASFYHSNIFFTHVCKSAPKMQVCSTKALCVCADVYVFVYSIIAKQYFFSTSLLIRSNKRKLLNLAISLSHPLNARLFIFGLLCLGSFTIV